MKPVVSYVGEKFPIIKGKENTLIRVLNSERTFWEKATILHKYANFPEGKTVPVRQSRHYYDFYCLLNSEAKESALNNLELLDKVVIHKSLYFRSAWASYNSAKKGMLKTIPKVRVLEAMEKDYKAMDEMFFGEIPSWAEIISILQKFETEFNSK